LDIPQLGKRNPDERHHVVVTAKNAASRIHSDAALGAQG
jgi:hypothetical protein